MYKKEICLNSLDQEKRLSASELKCLKGGSGFNCYCHGGSHYPDSVFFLEGFTDCVSAVSEAQERCYVFGLLGYCNC